MSYALLPGVPLAEAVTAVAASEVDAALVSLARVHASADPAAVHDVRKRTKKLRALAVALSGAVPRRQWRAASSAAAEAARTLAGSRDAEVRFATLTSLVADRQAEFADALAHAAALLRPTPDAGASARTSTAPRGRAPRDRAPRDRASGDRAPRDRAPGDDEQVQHASWLLTGVAAEIATWEIPDRFSSLRGGLGDTYRDGRRRWRALASAAAGGDGRHGPSLDAEELHRWRRAVKYRWYHTRLCAAIAPDVLGAEASLLDELGESLGVDHDLAVLVATTSADPGAWGGPDVVAELSLLAAERHGLLRARALDLGRQVYALPVDAHLDRLGRWWRQTARRPGTPR